MSGTAPYRDRYWLHILLFILTLLTTVWSGGIMTYRMLIYADATAWFSLGGIAISAPFVMDGLRFGGSLLLFLTVHEFGHYFAARRHGVAVSLPYFIPFPFNGIGTFGAVIRIRQQIPSMTKLFDIGAAGPLAGFVVAFSVLLVGFMTLPGLEYMNGMPDHEALQAFLQSQGRFPADVLTDSAVNGTQILRVGSTPLYWFLSRFFINVPPMWEMYHYPVLFAGWLGLFFTALNLLPVGQLDGGHIMYALVGQKWHSIMARSFVLMLLFSGAVGFVDQVAPMLTSFDPLLGQLTWVILSTILFLYAFKIFKGNFRWIVPVVFTMVISTAFVSRLPSLVSSFGYSGWFVWCLLIMFIIKVDHPPVLHMEPLNRRRKILGILSLLIFALCFSFKPLYIG